jgi:hypothetical protein
MRHALIFNNRICQVADEVFPVAPAFVWVGCPDEVTDQWDYVDGVFKPPGDPEPEPVGHEVPQSITARQGVLVLNKYGLLDDIEAAIQTMPREVQLTWERAYEWSRDWPLLSAMAQQFGLSDAQVDEMFILGATL